MKILIKLNLILLVALSLSTALVKLFSMEAEMNLFRHAGWSDGAVYGFGFIQLVGGLLLLFNKTRKTGAGIMAITFITASSILFVNQMIPFGISSLLFIVMAIIPLLKPVNFINKTKVT